MAAMELTEQDLEAADQQIDAILSPTERRRVEDLVASRGPVVRLTALYAATMTKAAECRDLDHFPRDIDRCARLVARALGITDAEWDAFEQQGAQEGMPDNALARAIKSCLSGPENN